LNIFHFSSSKSFQAGCSQFVFPYPCNLSYSKQAAVVFIPAFTFPDVSVLSSSKMFDIFLIRFFISLLYIKPLFPMNKQFSIDSFLDWKGHHWVSTHTFQKTALLKLAILASVYIFM